MSFFKVVLWSMVGLLLLLCGFLVARVPVTERTSTFLNVLLELFIIVLLVMELPN